jgi:citrate lyase subunit beta/citryl-CoA lyase
MSELIRRSVLCGPVNKPAFTDGAWDAGADAIMLDLEDSVPPREKERARSIVAEEIARAGRGGSDVSVRINGPWELAEDDLEAIVVAGLAAITVPVVETPDDVLRVDERLSALEQKTGLEAGRIGLAITIESVRGLFAAREIAGASPRIASITLGGEDYTQDLGVEPTAHGDEILLPQLQLILVAREAGIAATAGVLGGLAAANDLDVVRRAARWSREVGFRGAACLTRAQVAVVNDEFSPAPDAVERARALLVAHEEGVARGDGLIAFDGGLIDIPVVSRARRLLDRAEAIAAYEDRKAARRAAAA